MATRKDCKYANGCASPENCSRCTSYEPMHKAPEWCYALLSDGKPIVINYGSNTYNETNLSASSWEDIYVENELIGVTKDQAEAMFICCMSKTTDWDVRYNQLMNLE